MLLKTKTIRINYNIEVRFNEVDSYKIVHNSHYYNYFDIGRTYFVNHFLRQGFEDNIIGEPDEPYYFLVLKSQCRYINFAKYGDNLKLETIFKFNPEKKNALIELQHRICNSATRQKTAEGFTELGICNKNYELYYVMPDELKEKLMQNIEDYVSSPIDSITVR